MPKIMDIHFQRVDPAFRQRGDIVLQKMGKRKAFGLIWSGGYAYFKTPKPGMSIHPVADNSIVWRTE